jgi:short-subunit dehydrogenase
MSFKDSSIIITGGSKGIGLSIAKVFASKTVRPIVLIARGRDELKSAKKSLLEIGAAEVQTISLDITDEKAVSEINFAQYNIGILINNAGSFLFKSLSETSTKEFEQQFKINTFGAFNLTQAILPVLKEADRALIVNICSVASLKGQKESGAYSMSKHAVLGYTRSLRKELMKSNIAVTALNLGQTYSTSWKEVDIIQEKLIDPEDVGRLIWSLSELSARSVAEEIILAPQGGEVASM